MAKTYIDTVKYLVYTNVEISGLVEKPDVVGAIFGQTEGLLGDELDLRDLQKNGRIGRIEVDLSPSDGRTVGVIKIPSSLDMVETCIIAAALETVDRVGPCEARLRITKVEDTRNVKRKVLVDRAKTLLKTLIKTEIPESKEISDLVRDEVKVAEVVEYGPDRLSAGPGIERNDEVVFVEGRADVINLLKNDITNVVAIGGARVPRTIVELSKRKEVTLFLDGDRGGDIILNELVQGGVDIDYVARAPAGMEVEELTRKEMIKYLRNRIPFEQAGKGGRGAPVRWKAEVPKFRQEVDDTPSSASSSPVQYQPASYGSGPGAMNQDRRMDSRDSLQPSSSGFGGVGTGMGVGPGNKSLAVQRETRELKRRDDLPQDLLPPLPDETLDSDSVVRNVREAVRETVRETGREAKVSRQAVGVAAQAQTQAAQAPVRVGRDGLMKELEALGNTLRARFYNSNLERTLEVPVRDVIKALGETKDVHAIVFDGIITQRLADLAAKQGVKILIGIKIGNVNKAPENLEIVTKNK